MDQSETPISEWPLVPKLGEIPSQLLPVGLTFMEKNSISSLALFFAILLNALEVLVVLTDTGEIGPAGVSRLPTSLLRERV